MNSPQFKSALIVLAMGIAGITLANDGQTPSPATRQLLLHSMDSTAGLRAGGWRLNRAAVTPAPPEITPQVGNGCVRFRGQALGPGSKGDFALASNLPDGCVKLALWIHLTPDANVQELGFQFWDANGEGLWQRIPADWTGWRQIEFDADTTVLEQAWKQPDHDGKLDPPIRTLHLAWFTREAGETHLEVDGLTGTFTATTDSPVPFTADMVCPAASATNAPLAGSLILHNHTPADLTVTTSWQLAANPQLREVPAPDPVHGLDIARGTTAWTKHGGETLPEPSLTDGLNFTNREIPWHNDGHGEVFQELDLAARQRITKIAIFPTDANWLWHAEVSVSTDGDQFRVVPELARLDLHKRWQGLTVVLAEPVEARQVRVRYFREDEKPKRVSLPCRIAIYAGVGTTNLDLPELDGKSGMGTFAITVPAHGFALQPLRQIALPEDGAFLLRLAATTANAPPVILQQEIFSAPPPAPAPNSRESRFGINAAQWPLAKTWGDLGFGWVRFENMKWAMLSPAKDEFRFDGSVAPWHVNHDEAMKDYRAAGMQVMPYVFLVPEHATSAGPEVKKIRHSHPPRDVDEYRECVFQIVARYGTKNIPAAQLKTPDGVSGLGLLEVIEIWNEPNLNPRRDAGWGAWAAPLEEFWPVFRAGATGAKQADPDILVTSPGMAGILLEVLEPMRQYRYPDGKAPVDFMDIVNVHYYSGRQPPETATVDANVNRRGGDGTGRTYLDDLRELIGWRDRHAPGRTVWLTETGYDSAGSHGLNERLQAARLPRVTLLALASGVDKVFIYREVGSRPSQHAASGLLHEDLSPKPSYFAVATMLRELADMAQGPSPRLPDPDPNLWLYAWDTPRGTVLTAWTVADEGILDLGPGEGVVVDSFGGRRRRPTTAIPVGEFPVYIHGVGDLPAIQARRDAATAAEQTRLAHEARLSRLACHLFDFGGSGLVGIRRGLGMPREFVAVPGNLEFTTERSFGITNGPAYEQDRRWLANPLERDSCRLQGKCAFRFTVTPGRYRLRMSVAAVSADADLRLEGATMADNDGTTPASFTVAREGGTVAATIVANQPDLSLMSDRHLDIRWLELVADDEALQQPASNP